ncbi:MAG: hypothetical protein ACLRMZ_01395 [Blautia marasmi]
MGEPWAGSGSKRFPGCVETGQPIAGTGNSCETSERKRCAGRCAYPENVECAYHWNKEAGTLTVELPARVSARIFELRY